MSFPFLEKIGRAQIKKCEENFFAGWQALASGSGAERQFRLKKVRISSDKRSLHFAFSGIQCELLTFRK